MKTLMAFLYPQLLVVITHPKLLVVYFKTPKKKRKDVLKQLG